MKTARRKCPSVPLWSLGRPPHTSTPPQELRSLAVATAAVVVLSGCGNASEAAPDTRAEAPVVMQNAYETRQECAETWGEENCTDGFNPDGANNGVAAGTTGAAAGGVPYFFPGGRVGLGRYLGPRYFFDHVAQAAYMIRPGGAIAPVPTRASRVAMSTLQARGATAPPASSVTRGGFGSSAHASSSGGG